jgi:hypothetical protein
VRIVTRDDVVYIASTIARERYADGQIPVSTAGIGGLCEVMLSDPQTLARALAKLTPEQRQGVLVLYDKLASLGV